MLSSSTWLSLPSSLSLPNNTIESPETNCNDTFCSPLWNYYLWSSAFKIKSSCNALQVTYSPLKESHHLSVLNVVVYVVVCLTVIIFVWPDVTKTNKHKNWIYFLYLNKEKKIDYIPKMCDSHVNFLIPSSGLDFDT